MQPLLAPVQPFYPPVQSSLASSKQAMDWSLAELYVQGVSTRKVSAIVEELCGTTASSPQVSQCAARLDFELESW